jgi:hypothetical protein
MMRAAGIVNRRARSFAVCRLQILPKSAQILSLENALAVTAQAHERERPPIHSHKFRQEGKHHQGRMVVQSTPIISNFLGR